METPSISQIIKSIFEAGNLPRIPKKIRMSPKLFDLIQHHYEKELLYTAAFPTNITIWRGTPIEIDLDLFGYTYELVYEEDDYVRHTNIRRIN